MSLGKKLTELRKENGYSKEEISYMIGAKEEDIIKWEEDLVVPDESIINALCALYNINYEFLVNKEKEEIKNEEKEIDWSKVWENKYPILKDYENFKNIENYYKKIELLCENLEREYNISNLDSFLIVKDMIYKKYKKDDENKK
ncbi:helix-turn-helix domain-containing protein [Peptoniphilus stercorisuis]|uniref:Transcriptional regulator with XRE-family HTH domain n=1 Tax=Peptoniphilus stercorisuis TaxID=1436965 RepID=A0ABS4KDJ4_9FIRM|nr:helix-turn-helix transcriptional regulator [Peptoniphilus stercorisuis]MBP2025837.1 transcriptional regulator with XRE-family HTH domain [Peptoniphilus stercorisuis]